MAQDGDALRTAQALLRLHGERAETEARELWQMYRAVGATNAARVWQRVLTTLASMRSVSHDVLH